MTKFEIATSIEIARVAFKTSVYWKTDLELWLNFKKSLLLVVLL